MRMRVPPYIRSALPCPSQGFKESPSELCSWVVSSQSRKVHFIPGYGKIDAHACVLVYTRSYSHTHTRVRTYVTVRRHDGPAGCERSSVHILIPSYIRETVAHVFVRVCRDSYMHTHKCTHVLRGRAPNVQM